jgi:endonuclease/exonuclease/phosphatase family metal-dependent hydrolase
MMLIPPMPPHGRRARPTVVGMRLLVTAAVAGVLVLAGLQPAAAASTPSKVGVVSFVAADYSRSKDTTSLTIAWPKARHATKYQVFMSRSYSMSKARKYTTKARSLKVSGLARGRDYFFQVRGVNGTRTGTKSNRVGHTTIVRPGPTRGVPIRIMTYNVCSAECDKSHDDEPAPTRYPWVQTSSTDPTPRQPRAMERITAAAPDVIAAQEAGEMATPAGYVRVMDVSAKRLFIKDSRLMLAPGPAYAYGAKDKHGCRATTAPGAQAGHVLLGYHSSKCRYAVWAEVVDRQTGKSFLAVNVHTVTGTSSGAVAKRAAEMDTLMSAMDAVNASRKVPVVFAGDFNSHKNRDDDVVGSAMRKAGYRDAYDLARTLHLQHLNSYNGFATTPKIGYKWGDHVDHVYLRAQSNRVDRWHNAVVLEDGRLVKPIPSDHSPILVDVRIG